MILQLTIKATLVLFSVAVGVLVLRRSSAATRHLAQVAGLIAILALPVIVVGAPDWELPLLAPASGIDASAPVAARSASEWQPSAPQSHAISTPRGIHSTSHRPGGKTVPAPRAAKTAELVALSPPADTPPELPQTEPRSAGAVPSAKFQSGLKWFAFAWALGAALLLARLVVGWLGMTRTAFDATPLKDTAAIRLTAECCRRLGIAEPPRVLVSARIRVPVLWGFISPTLFLPEASANWSQGRLRVVLLHELAHLRRKDGLTLLLGRLATAAWWFHPMAWIVDRGARQDCERACDDLVLATGERPSEYAAHLLAIARELPRGPAPAGAMAVVGTSQLEARVRSILQPRVRRGMGRLTACAVLGVVSLALVPLSSARLVAREAQESPRAAQIAAVTSPESDEVASDEVMVAVRKVRGSASAATEADEYLLVHEGRYHEGQESFQRAYDHHREGDYAEAAPLFLAAAEAGYRPSTSFYNAGCGYAKMGDSARAVRYIEQAIDAGFDDGSLLMRDSDLDPIRDDADFRALLDGVRADRRSAIGRDAARQYDEVHGAYEELVDDGSTRGEDWYRVGSRLLQLREFDTGIEALQRAADLLENNQNALYNLACAYALRGDTATALDHLEQAVLAGFSSEERFADDTDLDSLRDSKRFAEIRDLSEVLSLDRFRKTWRFWHGDDYSPSRWEPAIEEFTEFTRKNPDIGRGWFNLGWALHYSSRHAEARKAFERQRSAGFRPGNATYNIACTYAMENNVDAALDALQQAISLRAASAGQMLRDEDLEILWDDPRFLEMVESAIENLEDYEDKHDQRRELRRMRSKHEHMKQKVY